MTVLEFIVAFSARRRKGELSGETFNVVVSRFLKDILDRFIVIGVDDELVALATSIAITHALPSADCLQLPCARSFVYSKASQKPGKRIISFRI
ncbi:MAG: type II toxin-antitoxin system VapC family toxin [Nitrososphaerota archaeon]